MPSDVRIRFIGENRASPEIRDLRAEVRQLKEQLGQSQTASRGAAEAVDKFGDESRQAATSVDALGDQSQQSARQVSGLGNATRRANTDTATITRSLGGLGTVIGGLGIAVVGGQLINLGRGFVMAASQVEGFRNGLTALYGDAQIANQVLSDLEGLAELPGITFEGAVQGALRLKTVGIEGERANAVIREFGNAAALAGNDAEALSRAMTGFSQAIVRGRLDQENLNQILENVPLIGISIREAFGTIEAQQIQAQLDAAGQSIQDFANIVVTQLSEGPRASAESTANAFSNLQNSVFRLQAEIGSQFLSSVRDATVGLSTFLDTIRRGVDDVSTLPQPIQDVVNGAQALFDALQEIGGQIEEAVGDKVRALLPALGTLVGTIFELVGAIGNALSPVLRLWAEIQGVIIALVTKLAQDLSTLIGGLTDAVNWITSLWQAEDRAKASTEGFTSSVEASTQALDKNTQATERNATAGDQQRQRLADLQTQLQTTNSDIQRYQERLERASEAANSSDIDFYTRRLELARQKVSELTPEIETLTARYGGASAALGENADAADRNKARLSDLQTELAGVNTQIENYQQRLESARAEAVGETNPSIQQLERRLSDAKTQAAGFQTEIDKLTVSLAGTKPASDSASASTENFSLRLAQLRARAEDVRADLENIVNADNIQASYQSAIEASDAFYDAQIANARTALEAAKQGSEERQQLETRVFELERQREQARQALIEEGATLESDIAQRSADARIESAERARAAEVNSFSAAARQGSAYAEQLEALASPSRRQAYIDIVESFQAQGVSLEEARRKAEPYYELLLTLATPIHAADIAFGDFSSTLVRGANESASAIGSLMTAVNALGTSIATRLPDARGALERAAQREADYFQQNPIGITLPDIQQEAGQQGRDFVNRLFGRQDREDERAAIEAQRDSIQLYNDLSDATVDFTSSLIDLQGETNLADHAFQDFLGTFGRLAAGDFTALLDIPIQLLNISREAAAGRQQGARDRAALYEDQFEDFSRFGRNFDVVSGALGIPESTELRDSFFFKQAGEFENVISQSTADFSDGIKNALLASVINLERDIRPEDIAGIFQSSIDRLQENLDAATFNLDFARQTDGDVEGALQDVIGANTEYYQRRIDAANVERRLFGDSIDNVEELNRILQAANNETALQLERAPTLVSQRGVVQRRQRDRAARQEGDASSDAYTRSLLETGDFTFEELNANDPIVAAAESDTRAAAEVTETAREVAERISDGQLSQSIRTASDTLNDMVAAGTSVSDLLTYINTELVPLWGQEYDDLVSDLVEQGLTLTQAQDIVTAEYGTRTEFTGNRTSAIIDPITEMNAEVAKQVAESVSDGQRGREIRTATDTLNDMIKAGESVADLETFINTELVPLWGTEYDDMIDDLVEQGHTLTQATDIVSATHGTRSEFTAGRTSAIIDPITEANAAMAIQVAESVSDGMRGREIRTATGTLDDMIKAGSSVADLLIFINETLVPLWGAEYDDMVDDLVGQGHTLTDAQNLVSAQHGTRSEFTGNRTSAIITPITEANAETAKNVSERVSDGTRDRAIMTTTATLNDLIKAGTSVDDLLAFINTELVPLWASQYQDYIDDLVEQGQTLTDAESIVTAEHGTRGEFISGRTGAIITPITESNQNTAERVAEIVSDNQLAGNIRTATMGLQELIKAGASVSDLQSYITENLVPLWSSQYQDMIDDLVEQGHTLADAQRIVESQHGTADTFIATQTSAIITPITESNETTARQVAESISDGTRGREIRTTTATLSDLVKAGESIEDVQSFINTELVPLWASQYQDMIDDLVTQGQTLADAQAIVTAQHGTADEFIAGLVSDTISPITSNIAGRAASTARTAGRTNIGRASFNLGGATSETGFETLQTALITQINTFYDDEEQRIRDLGGTAEEVSAAIAANTLARNNEIRGANDLTNEFEEDRLERIEDTEKEIQDLRDAALENEQDRQEAITELHEDAARKREEIEEDHQRRIEDIRRSATQSREDVEREFTQDIEDILRDAGVDESLFSHGNFDTIRRIAQSPSGLDDLQGFLSGLGINLDARGVEGVRSAGVERLRGLENVDIRAQRQQDSAQTRQTDALEDLVSLTERRDSDINAEAEATAQALTAALTPLLEESAVNTAAEKTDAAATNLDVAAGKTDAAATSLGTVAQDIADSDIPGVFNVVRESAAASLGIADAIEMFPAALESAVTDAFDRVLGELEEVFERLILLADTPTAPGGGGGGEGGAAALQPAAPAAMAVMEPAAPLAPAIPEETQLILPPVEQPVVPPESQTEEPPALDASGGVVPVSVTNFPAGFGSERPIEVQTEVNIDGDKVAESVDTASTKRAGQGRNLR